MTPRPVNRPRPIPFAAPAPTGHAPRPVSWATSAGPAQQVPVIQLATPLAPTPQPLHRSPASPVVAQAAKQDHKQINQETLLRKPAGSASHIGRQAGASSTPLELSAKFIGQGALSVRSSVTGRHYRFQGHGDCQKIDKHDLLMLKRIPDLIVS